MFFFSFLDSFTGGITKGSLLHEHKGSYIVSFKRLLLFNFKKKLNVLTILISQTQIPFKDTELYNMIIYILCYPYLSPEVET